MTIQDIGRQAKSAARKLATAPTQQKNQALQCMAEMLLASSNEILDANQQDLEEARQAGLSPAMLDRLMLNPGRLQGIAADLLLCGAIA